MGVWIETQRIQRTILIWVSHPAWVCGLKQYLLSLGIKQNLVTPCVGVWIETIQVLDSIYLEIVTPCVGVWIETLDN